jgi:DnaJ domain
VPVSASDPFAVLGVAPTATLAEVRAARRRLALQLHPDRGGDAERMQEVNRAFDQAVRALLGRPERAVPPPSPAPAAPTPRPAPRRPPAPTSRVGPWIQYDEPSFTVDVLPVEAFDALTAAAVHLGEVVAEDPPYVLEVVLADPWACWCRFELLPEAGATTVMLIVAGLHRRPPPAVEEVRDLWVDALNSPPGE